MSSESYFVLNSVQIYTRDHLVPWLIAVDSSSSYNCCVVHYKLVSEHFRSMANPTQLQRVELLEGRLENVENLITERVDSAVERALTAAIAAMRVSLAEQIRESQVEISKKAGVELEAVAMRLEGRINHSRESQEGVIN